MIGTIAGLIGMIRDRESRGGQGRGLESHRQGFFDWIQDFVHRQSGGHQEEMDVAAQSLAEDQFAYQQGHDQKQMDREDTQLQRMVVDARAAGISPIAALGNATYGQTSSNTGTGGGPGGRAGGRQTGIMRDLISLATMNANIERTNAERDLFRASAARQTEEAGLAGARARGQMIANDLASATFRENVVAVLRRNSESLARINNLDASSALNRARVSETNANTALAITRQLYTDQLILESEQKVLTMVAAAALSDAQAANASAITSWWTEKGLPPNFNPGRHGALALMLTSMDLDAEAMEAMKEFAQLVVASFNISVEGPGRGDRTASTVAGSLPHIFKSGAEKAALTDIGGSAAGSVMEHFK